MSLKLRNCLLAAGRRRLAAWSVCAIALLAACSSDNRKVLIVYSPHGKELLEYFEKAFEKAHPDIDVQWVDMGSQEVLERVRAEKPNPQADVWFGRLNYGMPILRIKSVKRGSERSESNLGSTFR